MSISSFQDPLTTKPTGATGAWHRVAAGTAAVAAVFSLVVGAVMLYDVGYRRWKDPLEAPAMKALLDAIREQPTSEKLKEQYRQLDQQARDEYFRHRQMAAGGTVLLVWGTVVFLIAAASTARLRRRLPQPGPLPAGRDIEAQWTRFGRWGVAGLAVTLVAAAAGLIATIRSDLPREAAEVVSPGEVVRETPQEPAFPPPPSDEETARAWPRFRGPNGSGISAYTNVPDTWDGPSGKNILWKTPVPLGGFNSPVVWGNRVFLSGATEKQRQVYGFDAADGKLLWQCDVPGTPQSNQPIQHQILAEYASPTTATDGRLVYAIFVNGDVAAVNFQGKLRWARSLGIPENDHGQAASLVTYKDLLLVQLDQGKVKAPKSKFLALDVDTGKTVWQKARPVPCSWSTPIVIRHAGRDQLITSGNPWIIAYDPATGEEIWRSGGLNGEVCPSPVFADGMVYVPGSETSDLRALRVDGRGDVTETHMVWLGQDGKPDTCSPLAAGQFVFLLTSGGILTCYDAKRGDKLWEHDLKLDTSCQASPSMVGGRLYVVAKDGKVHIVEPSATGCKRIGLADVGEPCVTSPAFQDGRIYLRGETHLFCIGQKR